MVGREWSRDELVLAMKLYCRLPFGQVHLKNVEIINLAKVMGRTPSSVAMKLSNFASLDPALQEKGLKGLPNASRADRALWDECYRNWEGFADECEKLSEKYQWDVDLTFLGATEKRIEKPVRIAQRFFRQVVLAAYDNRCCISDLNLPMLLVASHIKPWGQFAASQVDPQNGLCLSRLHDAAFDCGLITLDSERRLVLAKQLKTHGSNKTVSESFLAFEAKQIRFPEKFFPKEEYLCWHRENLFIDR